MPTTATPHGQAAGGGASRMPIPGALDHGTAWDVKDPGPKLSRSEKNSRRPSGGGFVWSELSAAERLGQRDDDALGAADVAEPLRESSYVRSRSASASHWDIGSSFAA